MDGPVMEWLHGNVGRGDVFGKHVLEVGSGDVNGSVRPHIINAGALSYIGVDLAPGKGVDEVVSAYDLVDRFGAGSFDVVVSTEMLEHVEHWRRALLEMKGALRPGGLLVLTTRRPGFPRHCHPHDHWRFTKRIMRLALADFQDVQVENVEGDGIVVKARKPMDWEAKVTQYVVQAIPAPAQEYGWKRRRLWAVLAYRGRDPTAYPCCEVQHG